MNLKKRALHLAVAAGVVGSAVGVAAPAAHAAAPIPPDTCGVYIQGTIDPAGGVLPAGIIPIKPPGTPQTYAASGHLRKGQDKVLNDLNNSALGAKRFALGIELGADAVKYPGSYDVAPGLQGANPAPPVNGKTTIKIGWANHKTINNVTLLPTVQVAETDGILKYAAAKGTVVGVGGPDNLGAQVGNIQMGHAAGLTPAQNTKWNVVVPNAATGGTYTLAATIPANSFAVGVPPVDINLTTVHNYNASAANIAATIAAAPAWAAIGATATVTGTNFVSGSTNGDYTIELTGALTSQPSPAFTSVSTGDLATRMLDDGSIWAQKRFGGIDPGSPISDLGQGIFTAAGVMSSGVVGGVGGKNTGKANIGPDTQFTFVQYPRQIESNVAPRIGTNNAGILATLGVLSAITGNTVAELNRNCSAAGLLALFCYAQPAIIPATFAGLCGAILGP